MNKSEQDKLDEAVAIVLKYKSQLNMIQLNALYFSLFVEVSEREQKEDKL